MSSIACSVETFAKRPLSSNLRVAFIPPMAGLEIFNIFLWLKSSRALILNEIEHFSKVSRYLFRFSDKVIMPGRNLLDKLESKSIAGIHTMKEIYPVKRKLGYLVGVPRHGKNLTEKVVYRYL